MLLNKTTELGIQSLLYLASLPADTLITPPKMAATLESSPTYMSKVLRMLAKGEILESHRGIAGGFMLTRKPENITLLEIVVACQGTIASNYCTELSSDSAIRNSCGYHQAMVQLRDAVESVLKQWTLQMVIDAPAPTHNAAPNCKMRTILSKLP